MRFWLRTPVVSPTYVRRSAGLELGLRSYLSSDSSRVRWVLDWWIVQRAAIRVSIIHRRAIPHARGDRRQLHSHRWPTTLHRIHRDVARVPLRWRPRALLGVANSPAAV